MNGHMTNSCTTNILRILHAPSPRGIVLDALGILKLVDQVLAGIL